MESNELIVYIIDYLDTNLYRDVSIQELSFYFGYDKYYIMKKFKSEIGISIKTYVNRMKIISSLSSLKNDELILKVALEYGFNSLEYYSEVFSRTMGFSPSVFRRYLNNSISKEELDMIKNSINELNDFKEFIQEYKSSLNKENVKMLRLQIPQEKKCA